MQSVEKCLPHSWAQSLQPRRRELFRQVDATRWGALREILEWCVRFLCGSPYIHSTCTRKKRKEYLRGTYMPSSKIAVWCVHVYMLGMSVYTCMCTPSTKTCWLRIMSIYWSMNSYWCEVHSIISQWGAICVCVCIWVCMFMNKICFL